MRKGLFGYHGTEFNNLSLVVIYKIMFGMEEIDSHNLFCLRANIKPKAMVLRILAVRSAILATAWLLVCQRVVNVWNSFPVSIVNLSSFNSLKRSLQNVNLSIFY